MTTFSTPSAAVDASIVSAPATQTNTSLPGAAIPTVLPATAPPAGPCARFQKFEHGLAHLAQVFLPKAIKQPPLTYTEEEVTSSKAFLVFAHAELEDYLEDCCREKARRALDVLTLTGSASVTAFSLVSHFGEKRGVVNEIAKYKDRDLKLAKDFTNYDPALTRSLLSRLKEALEVYIEQCRTNHGVKEANLLQMLIPLGLNPLVIDGTWIAELNGFGTDRGAHAHRGLAGVQQILDPFASLERIKRIINGPPGSGPGLGSTARIYSLRSLDAWLTQ